MSILRLRTLFGDLVGLRPALLGMAFFLMPVSLPVSAFAAPSLLPDNFFAQQPVTASDKMVINADLLSVRARSGLVVASGNVRIFFAGYAIAADRIEYDQRRGSVVLVGQVVVKTPNGQEFLAERAELTDTFRQGFLQSLVFRAEDGSYFTAEEASLSADGSILLTGGAYSPCGTCIDDQGRRIGWRIKAAQIERNEADQLYYFVSPELELLGVSIPLLPSFTLPVDGLVPTGLQLPRISYGEQRGLGIGLPYRFVPTENSELVVTPTLYTRQGIMAGAEWTQELENGTYTLSGWSLFQLDPAAYAGEPGDRDWRGAVQTTGSFSLADNWTAGWSLTAFTDPAFLPDYDVGQTRGGYVVNEVFATKLSPEIFADIRVQQFVEQGNVTPLDQAEQASAVPVAEFDSVYRLAEGNGEIRFRGSFLNVNRGADQIETVGGVPRSFGFEGNKTRATLEAGWTNQYIGPAGVVVSPYVALRADAASYNGASGDPLAPPGGMLLSATPIAALDLRWPLVSSDAAVAYLLEPIAQIVWRGGAAETPGITNDDAQSFVFDDTNLFSFNRFSGDDRQETGLRASLGVRYNVQFSDGAWLDAVAGKSYQISGLNAFGVPDPVLTGAGSGLDDPLSYYVIGVTGAPRRGVTLGAKAQLDVDSFSLARAAMAATIDNDMFAVTAGYAFIAANPALGVVEDLYEVNAGVKFPLADYWSAQAGLNIDMVDQSVAQYNFGVAYDDEYLGYGIGFTGFGPTHASNPDSARVEIFLKLYPLFETGGIGAFD
ncbi:MAG: LPS-assembly protein LptD [Alphaproteobacteria bacterium]|nr:LPS-assembly protein LptD [Alphaproteobacteria bacterium]